MKENPSFTSTDLQLILDNTKDGIILFESIHDERASLIDLKFLLFNNSAAQILGQSPDSLKSNTYLGVFPNKVDSSLLNSFFKVLKDDVSINKEISIIRDGIENWYKLTASKFDNKLLVNYNNITDYHLMIAQKTRTKNLYRTLISSLPHADVALISKGFVPVLIEGRPFKSLSIDKKIEEGDKLERVLSPESLAVLKPILKDCFDSNSRRLEIEKYGHLFRVNFQPVRDEKGVVNRVLMVSEDISIFKATQNELRNKIYNLESANQGLEQFAYVASHDLQEPLRKIRAFGDRLQSKYQEQLDDTAGDYIERMQNAAQRMQNLINDLLKYSRAGRDNEAFKSISLNTVVDSVLDTIDERVKETDAIIKVEPLPEIEAHPNQLEQLFLNLLTNALKFKKESENPEINIWCEEVNEAYDSQLTAYRIHIEDNGIGFDEKYIDRIFEIFQRLHGRHQYEGTGIGLAICRKIVENHGGKIYAKSKKGKGSTFVVKLPKYQEQSIV